MSQSQVAGPKRATKLLTAGVVIVMAIGLSGAGAQELGGQVSASVRSAVAGLPNAATGLTNDEVVVADLDASGLPVEMSLISRITSDGGPPITVEDPASLTNVHYLDRLGRPETRGEFVLIPSGGDGRRSVLTTARFDKPLPLALHAQYELNGQVVPPEQVLGSDAELKVIYTLTNTTAKTTKLTYSDAAGVQIAKEEPVFAPFAGQLLVTVPADVTILSAKDAIRSADARGNTVLQWNAALYPPIGSYQLSATVRLLADRAGIPAVSARLVPTTAKSNPATELASTILDSSVTGNQKLYSGLTKLDDSATSLSDGASQLADGVSALASGTRELAAATTSLSDGLVSLADGAHKVADGEKKVADALAKVANGADAIAAATAQLASADSSAADVAMTQLVSAAGSLQTGAQTLADRFGSSADQALPTPLPAPDTDAVCQLDSDGVPEKSYDDDCVTLYQGVRALREGLVAIDGVVATMNTTIAEANTAAATLRDDLTSIGTDSATAAVGSAALVAQLCGATPAIPPAACTTLASVAQSSGRAATTTASTVTPMTDLLTALAKLTAYATALQSATTASVSASTSLLTGMDAFALALKSGSSTSPGLVEGMAALTSGLQTFAAGLNTSSASLADALDKLDTGSASLATGVNAAADGAAKLADGAAAVAKGADQAATGSQQLADGASALASGAAQASTGSASLAEGVEAFQTEGTFKIAESVLKASKQPALIQAWLDAADERAAHALPYGPPRGATGHVVYLLDIPAQAAPAKGLWDRLKSWLAG